MVLMNALVAGGILSDGEIRPAAMTKEAGSLKTIDGEEAPNQTVRPLLMGSRDLTNLEVM